MLPLNAVNIIAIEEEHLEERRVFNRERRLMRDETDPFVLEEETFRKTFRLTKDMAQYVFNRIIEAIDQPNNVVAVPAHFKFFCAFNFYATGSYQKLIGQSYNISMSQQAVSRSIEIVTGAIVNTLAQEWINNHS